MTKENKYLLNSFIEETAKEILQEIISNPSKEEVLTTIEEEYNKTNKYPNEAFELIKNAISGNKSLENDYLGIFNADQDNMLNLYDSIFYFKNSTFEEEEEEENISTADEQLDIMIEDDDIPECSYFSYDESSNQQEESIENQKKINMFKSTVNQQINDVSTQLSISKDLSFLLLKKLNWNKTRVISLLKKNQDLLLCLLTELHVSELDMENDLTMKVIEQGTCPLCEQSDVTLYKMYCGHYFCKECWKTKIMFDIALQSNCKCHKCDSEIMIADVLAICGEEIASIYEGNLIQQAFSDTQNFQCTSFKCGNVISKDTPCSGNVLTCLCGEKFCSKCHKQAHSPLKCDQVDDFEKYRDEMRLLYKAQKEYYDHELDSFYYRIANVDEVIEIINEFIEKIEREYSEMNQSEIDEISRLKNESENIRNSDLKSFVDFAIKQKIKDHEMKVNSRSKQLESIQSEMMEYLIHLQDGQLMIYNENGILEVINDEMIESYKKSKEEEQKEKEEKEKEKEEKEKEKKEKEKEKEEKDKIAFTRKRQNSSNSSNSSDDNNSDDKTSDNNNSNDNNSDDSKPCKESIDYTNMPYTIPPLNSIILSKHREWESCNEKCKQISEMISKPNSLYSICTQSLGKQDATKKYEDLHSNDQYVIHFLVRSYKASFFMDHESHRFEMFNALLKNLESINGRFNDEIKKYVYAANIEVITDLSSKMKQIVDEIQNEFDI